MVTIVDTIMRTYPLDTDSIRLFMDKLQPLHLKKREILIEPGKIDKQVYFVEEGILRSYTVIDGKEVTSWFSAEGDLSFSTASFYGESFGYETETVQALENSLVYYMSIVELEQLCLQHIGISNWLRLLHQRAFVETEKRLISRLYMSARERYDDLYKRNPALFRRVNLGFIASYLGVSQVTLCALRK